MKLVLAILHDEDGPKVMEALNKGGFSVTRLSSSGGFLRAGNTTLVVGVDEERVEDVVNLVKSTSKSRKKMIDSSTMPANSTSMGGMFMPYPVEVVVGGATIFVLNVERFEKE
ncbi:MAG: cyclic-di-AMP receptor [Oscillospiraceae bacterium]|nr:cyclic-di-AMP receptor [Oscillospiraceae bacterium]